MPAGTTAPPGAPSATILRTEDVDPRPEVAPVAARRDSPRLLLVAAVLVLVGLRVLSLVDALQDDGRKNVPAFRGDARRYLEIAQSKGTPYADFEVEYPPVTLALTDAIAGDDTRSTLVHVGVVMLALDLLIVAGMAYGWGARAMLAYLVLSTPFLFLPFIYFRVDLLSVALAIWGLALVRRHHDVGGGVLLALAVFAKLWPLAVLPALIAARRGRALVSAVATGLVGAVAWFAIAGTRGFEQVLTFRGARGWQIESVTGGIVRWFTGEFPRSESGALRVGDAPLWATLALGLTMLVAVGWIWREVVVHDADDVTIYGVAPLTAITVFMVCSPLLSPQFVLWLVPFAAICWIGRERVLSALVGISVLATMLLTQLYMPLNNDQLSGHAALAARNALLLGIVVVGICRVRARCRQVVAA